MYLFAKIEIDPSQATEIKKVKPTSFFEKFIDVLSLGKASGKVEKETFSAVAILEKIYAGLHSIKVDNIIRLAVDEYDFYFDDSGQESDMDDAISHFTHKVDPIESELFETLFLVMEHSVDSLKLLIEIRINRKHKVGEYPIVIIVNAVVNEFQAGDNLALEQIKEKMKNIFANANEYNDFVDRQKRIFDSFINQLEYAVRKYIEADDIRRESKIQVIRPKSKMKSKKSIKHTKKSKPAYYGYYGFDDYFLYAWLWGDMMHEYNIYTHNIDIVDELGNEVMHIGDNGFNAADSDTLNSDADFEPVKNADIEYYRDNEYESEIKNDDWDSGSADSDSTGFYDDSSDADFDNND
jgi:hypothetical protein